jgi:hypothetical protein
MASNEALLDASAFLELEKGLPDQNLDGVEAAILAAQASINTTTPTSASSVAASSVQPVMRINKNALDRIAAAAKGGGMTTFGSIREDTIMSMEAVRAAQVSIFHEHMRFDVCDMQEDLDFRSKDFLTNFQTAHLAKEKHMSAITKELETLSVQLGELNARTGMSSIPGDPLGVEKPIVAPKMSLKSAVNKVMDSNKIKGSRLNYAVADAITMAHLTQHVGSVLPQSSFGPSTSGSVLSSSSSTATPAGATSASATQSVASPPISTIPTTPIYDMLPEI